MNSFTLALLLGATNALSSYADAEDGTDINCTTSNFAWSFGADQNFGPQVSAEACYNAIAAVAEAADAAGATYCGGAIFDSEGSITACAYLYLNGGKSDIREVDTGNWQETYESWAWYDTYPWGQHPDDPAPEPEEPEPTPEEEDPQPEGEGGQECLEGEECPEECPEGEECPEECAEGEECETDEWSLSVRVQATGFAAAAMVVINI